MPDEDDQILDDEDLEDEELDEDDEDEGDEDEESSEPPVDIAALVKRLDATESVNKELRESVARFQSLLARTPADPSKGEREALASSVDDVYDILGAIAGDSDDSFLDDSIKERIKKALGTRQAARAQQSTEQQIQAAVLSALQAAGVPVPGAQPGQPDPRRQVAELTARLETELTAEIESYGLNPDDFDWDEASEILGKSGPDGLRSHIRTQIRTAIADEGKAARRQSRKASNVRSPRGGAPAASGVDVLKGNDEKAKREYLRSLGVNGV
mgnify:FL=1